MTLSQCCFDIHNQIKTLIPDIKRSQIYELVAAQLGYRTYKHLCEDALLLSGKGHHHFVTDNAQLVHQRIQDMNVKIPNSQLNTIVSVIQNCLAQSQFYAPTAKTFTNKLLPSINYRQGFDILDKSDLYQDFYQMFKQSKFSMNALIAHLFLLSRILPEWDEGAKTKSRIQYVKDTALMHFDKKEVLPYFIIFELIETHISHLTPSDKRNDAEMFYAFSGSLRDVIKQNVADNNLVKAHAWYQLALKQGFSDILSGRASQAYETTYENGVFYDSDDGAWYAIDEGYDEIVLPELDNHHSHTQVQNLLDEYSEMFEKIQLGIQYIVNQFDLRGYRDSEPSYWWIYEYYEYDDDGYEYDENDFDDENW